VRAAGLNFRDVVVALGMVDDGRPLLGEAAGIVLETAPDVTVPAVGDRVMGLFNGVGPVAATDARLLAPVPKGWTDLQAATTPIVFLTAMYALDDLAGLRPGERVLIHAAAGGVGLAALQIAALRGAEVFATASAPKWPALIARGVPAERIASSRELGFEAAFDELGGVDVVLNSLAGPAVDASLRLLRPGGRFIEMGKTDIRPAAQVARDHPASMYQAFDLMQAGPDRLAELLAELGRRIREGAVTALPAVGWDATAAAEAFRHLSRAVHVGKVGLSLRRPLDPEGTVLITGGTGSLGTLVAADLATRHGVRHILLVGRRGPSAPGATELVQHLAELGAEARVEACDAADRTALAALLAGIPAKHPLTAVVHTAGVLADATLENLTPDRLHRVLEPKVDAAWNLHELTAGHDLAAFVLFSSIAGTLGAPGQANYAAANTFLDALARLRRGRGLPATSLAWAHWAQDTGMTGHLSEVDRARMRRSGTLALPTAAGLDLLAAALHRGEPALVPVQLDLKALRRPGAAEPHPVLRALAGSPAARPDGARPGPDRGAANAGADALASQDPQRREERLLALTRAHAAAILGHDDPRSVTPGQAFKELGFDSLTSVELRNRLATATGLRVPAAAVFDHPTPDRLAAYLASLAGPPAAEPPSLLEQISRLRSAFDGLGAAERGRDRDRASAALRELLRLWQDAGGPGPDRAVDLAEAGDEELFSELDEALGDVR
jgi:polyketide synthase 12